MKRRSFLSNSCRINQEVNKQGIKFIIIKAFSSFFSHLFSQPHTQVAGGGVNEKIEIIKGKYNLLDFYDTSGADELLK